MEYRVIIASATRVMAHLRCDWTVPQSIDTNHCTMDFFVAFVENSVTLRFVVAVIMVKQIRSASRCR